MRPASLPTVRFPSARLLLAGAAAIALAGGAALWAQVEGERGIAPVAASDDFEIGGIEVDTRGDNAEAARQAGWLEAQRLAWKKLGGPAIADGQLQSLVSAIVIDQERVGPRRYVATLGVIFDRQRAARLLGEGGERARSAPLLLLPVSVSAGTATLYETRTPWQRAWAEFQAGGSRIDYVRPSGAGGRLPASDLRADAAPQPAVVAQHPRPVRGGRRTRCDRRSRLPVPGRPRRRALHCALRAGQFYCSRASR